MKVKLEKSKWALKKPYLVKKKLSGGKKDTRYDKFTRYLKKTGISPDETWALYSVITEFTLPRLKLFREIHGGHPMGLTEESWNEMLDHMIFAFEWSIMENDMPPEYCSLSEKEKKRCWKRYSKGMKLFSGYFMGLWW